VAQQDTIAVIGSGIIGAAVALALAREGRRVVLLDRSEPGTAGASSGNVGHIAAELVQPLPSPALLFGFWRELVRFGGPLDLPLRQALKMLPWIRRFSAAAFRRAPHTRALAPLVRPASMTWTRWLQEIGRPELLRRHGHYEIGLGRGSPAAMRNQAASMARLGIRTEPLSADQLLPLRRAAGARVAAGLWFEDSAHVTDPLSAVQAFAQGAAERGTLVLRAEVRALQPRGDRIEIHGAAQSRLVDAVVVCAGMGSQALLAPFGIHTPLQSVRGYHIEMPAKTPYFDAPILHTNQHVLVTPMTGRLRASSFMEFAPEGAPADAGKVASLRRKLRALGYACDPSGPSWVGSRPILPDYLPGIGRAPGPIKLYYATGHQHIGLTVAPVTADLVADLVAQRPPRLPVAAFDLRRFGLPPSH
jgi:D-amino-acid dehydrogenase